MAIPDYLNIVSPKQPAASACAIAEKNVVVLNAHMQEIYEENLQLYMRNIRAQHPIILALFSGQGGRSLLYRPDQEPLEAPRVPIVYELAKACGHSSMAVYQLVAPYLSDPSDRSWQGPMHVYRARHQAALEGVESLEIEPDKRQLLTTILKHNNDFMDKCLSKGSYSLADLEEFAHSFKTLAQQAIGVAAHAQVNHWMDVFSTWKEQLGKDWERTYAATNSLYVTRQNNIIFTILAQLMGTEAMNDRLLLLETTSFEITPEQILELLTRIISDRALGKVFFKDYFLMDYELLGSGARKAIEEAARKRGLEPVMPSLAPFRSTEWPWKTNPKSGTGPTTLEEIA